MLLEAYGRLKHGFPLRPDRAAAGVLALSLLVLIATATEERAAYRTVVIVSGCLTLAVFLRNRLWLLRRWPLRFALLWGLGMTLSVGLAGGQFLEKNHLIDWGLWTLGTTLPMLGFAIAAGAGVLPPKWFVWVVAAVALIHGAGALVQFGEAFETKQKQLPRGWMGWHTHLGEFLSVAFTLVLAWALSARPARANTTRAAWLPWAFFAVFALVAVPALVVTTSRTAYLGLVLGPVVLLVLRSTAGSGLRLGRRGWGAVLGALVALVAVFAGLIALAPEGSARYGKFDQLFSRGIASRQAVWSRAWELIQERPLLGHGLSMDGYFGGTRLTRPHSVYLESWMAGGLLFALMALGLSLFAGYAWWVLRRAEPVWGAAGIAVGAVLAVSVVFHHSMFDDARWSTLWAAWIGLGLGYLVQATGAQRRPFGLGHLCGLSKEAASTTISQGAPHG